MIDYSGEVWKKIYRYPDYLVSNMGRVKTQGRTIANKNGTEINYRKRMFPDIGYEASYNGISLLNKKGKKVVSIHRLVASLFCKNPHNNPCVNHKSGIELDNRACNLEWVTQSQNKIHADMNRLMQPEYTVGVFDDNGLQFSPEYLHYLEWKER